MTQSFNILVGMAALCSAEVHDVHENSQFADNGINFNTSEEEVREIVADTNETAAGYVRQLFGETSKESHEMLRILLSPQGQEQSVNMIMKFQEIMKPFYEKKMRGADWAERMAVLGRYKESLTAKFGAETAASMIEALKFFIQMAGAFPSIESQADLENLFRDQAELFLPEYSKMRNEEETDESAKFNEKIAKLDLKKDMTVEDILELVSEVVSNLNLKEIATELAEMSENRESFFAETLEFVRKEMEVRRQATVEDVTPDAEAWDQ